MMHLANFHLYKGKRRGLLSALTLNDATYWGADIFAGVVFALFITNNIDGGTATHVGIAYGMYRLIRAAFSLPLGHFFDLHKGKVDEMWALVASGLLVGSIYCVLFSVTQLWALYVCMFFIAVGHALNIGAWKILFYGNITDDAQGEVMGTYESVMQVVYALATVGAGFVGDTFGFEWTMLIAGIITVFSSIVPIMVRSSIR